MDLRDFTRGPALILALAVFVLGTLWRFARLLRLPRMHDLSPPREGAPSIPQSALRAIAPGMWPRREFIRATRFVPINGYVFHIGLEAAARRVLAALGFELVELKDHGVAGLCCGGGGGVVSNQRATPLRQKVFALKQQQVEATSAKRFITSCGQCRITLEMGAKNAKWDRPTESLLGLVADNLEA